MNNYGLFSLFLAMSQTLNIAFYNLDNLFDPFEASHTLDYDFTPQGKKKWGNYRYQQKLYKISRTIQEIHQERELLFCGIAEVETGQVISDLLRQAPIENLNLGFVHFDSPDSRGIDVGLIYNKSLFELGETFTHSVELKTPREIIYSRDILEIHGTMGNSKIRVFVNHWPSHRRRLNKSLRTQASFVLEQAILENQQPDELVIVMGDFNDNPDSEFLKFLEKLKFKNTSKELLTSDQGTTKHLRNWLLFDQIYLSSGFFEGQDWQFESSRIFNEEFLIDPTGRNKNQPFRTFIGKNYIGGQSDHFPILTKIKKT